MSAPDPEQRPSGAEDPALEEAMGWIELLAAEVGPRRPTRAGERRAAELTRDRLAERGVPSTLEDFKGYASFGYPFALIIAAAIAPGLISPRRRVLRSALAAGAGAGLLTEGSLIHTPLSGLLSRRPSQNLVATLEPRGRSERTLCLMAHLDTSRSGLIFDPRFVGMLGPWIKLNSLLVAGMAVAEPLSGHRLGVRRLTGASRAVLSGSLALLLERELRGVDVPGANDNASGCAVVATLAAAIAREPPKSTRVVVCLTGCEESGTLGAQAFLARRDTTGWRFLNFDNVGGPGTLRYLRREGVIGHWDADPGLIAVADAVASARPELQMAPEDSPAGLTYDASPVMARGGRALTLSIQDGSIPNLHWPTDTFENVDRGGVGRAVEAGRAMISAIDAGAAD